MSQEKARHPDPDEQSFVAELIEKHGMVTAAKRLGLSRLATLNVAHGGNCYPSTLRQVNSVRLGSASPPLSLTA
jgi:hypothetical protein